MVGSRMVRPFPVIGVGLSTETEREGLRGGERIMGMVVVMTGAGAGEWTGFQARFFPRAGRSFDYPRQKISP